MDGAMTTMALSPDEFATPELIPRSDSSIVNKESEGDFVKASQLACRSDAPRDTKRFVFLDTRPVC